MDQGRAGWSPIESQPYVAGKRPLVLALGAMPCVAVPSCVGVSCSGHQEPSGCKVTTVRLVKVGSAFPEGPPRVATSLLAPAKVAQSAGKWWSGSPVIGSSSSVRMSGWLKLNMALMDPAMVSVDPLPMRGRNQLFSMNFGMEDWSMIWLST